MSKSYIVSMDPAQLHDYSALAVLEKTDTTYRILSLKHKQHLPYTEIVEWAKKVFLNPKFSKDVTSPPVFVLDIGGVGMAIKDMMTAAKVETVGIQYTGGAAVSKEGDNWHVSKSFIVGKFLAAWDESRVLMPSGASFLDMFQGELRAFRGEMSAQGRAKFEAEQGEHDDLATFTAWLALALSSASSLPRRIPWSFRRSFKELKVKTRSSKKCCSSEAGISRIASAKLDGSIIVLSLPKKVGTGFFPVSICARSRGVGRLPGEPS